MTDTTNQTPNRTDIRHRLLASVALGEITIIVEALVLNGSIVRQLDVLRDSGYVSTDHPAELTDTGRALLSEWDARYGHPRGKRHG